MPVIKWLQTYRQSIIFAILVVGICICMFVSKSFMTIAFGICIFLYAISVLEKSFASFTIIENFLKKTTDKRYKSFSFGFITTCLMQSSGLVSILAISFLSAGLINLAAGLAIIFGVNLGTIAGAWLIAGVGIKADIAYYAMPLIVVGMLFLFKKGENSKGFGYFLFSIGLLFLGIAYIKTGFDGVKESLDLTKYAMSGIGGLLLYTAVGIGVTIVMQSSHATLTLAITALSFNQLSYENAIAIAIGSNVGSTIMAVLGSINANLEGKKLMVAHVIFNVTSALIALIFIKLFMFLTDITSEFVGIKQDDFVLKLAVFNTYFNVVGVCLFYPLTDFMANLLNKFVKFNKKRSKVDYAKYLGEKTDSFGDSASIVLVKEMEHLYENTSSILAKSISISKSDIASPNSSEEIIASRQTSLKINFDELYNNRFKEIYSQIMEYLINASLNAKKDDLNKFMDIRRCALLLAEVLKDMKNVQPNIYKFMTSSNPNAKAEYDKLRIKMLHGLRIIEKMRNLKLDDKAGLAKLRELKEEYKNIALDPDKLLEEKKISNKMATSMINDIEIVKGITKKLLKIVEISHSHKDDELSNLVIQNLPQS
ncbi:MAG: Na/Pi cotransporter family protein [Campylobacter sp.]|nr:Na/Pi cotransporter family protein [Campylobacter sp.]